MDKNINYSYTRDDLLNDIPDIQIIPYRLSNDLHSEIILPNSSAFIENIPEYFKNTKLNESHINSITESIIKDNIIIGDFSAVQCREENNRIYLIDGHHRKEALSKLTINQLDNIKIKLMLYHVDKIDSDKTYSLFCKINNVKPHALIKRYTHDAREVVHRLQQQHRGFYKGLVKARSNTSIVNKPRININIFINDVEEYLKKKKIYNIEDIVSKIISYNNNIEKKQYHTIYMYDPHKYIDPVKKCRYIKLKKQMKDDYSGFYMSTPYGENWKYNL